MILFFTHRALMCQFPFEIYFESAHPGFCQPLQPRADSDRRLVTSLVIKLDRSGTDLHRKM